MQADSEADEAAAEAVSAPRRLPVSGHEALIRAATGFGMATAILVFISLVWPEIAELSPFLVVLGSVNWMHEADDRHSTWAALAGGAVALLVTIGVATLRRHGEPELSSDLAYAAIGALAGSQVYAMVTRWNR